MGLIKKIKEKVSDYFNPDNEKAYNKFSESEKKEMLESLKMVDSTDLYGLDFSDLGESTIESSRGDTVNFREGVVKKDNIGNYIIVNGMKCREYQPGISGFVYKDIRDRYNRKEWLNVGFCEKGVFKKSIIINEKFGPKTVDEIPGHINKKLGGPFYEVNDTKSIKNNPLYNISRDSVYPSSQEDPKLSKPDKEHSLPKNRKNKNGEISVNVNGMWFKPFKEGVSGFIYQEFSDSNEHNKYILLAEYKDGKMVGEGVILNSYSKTYITKSNRKD